MNLTLMIVSILSAIGYGCVAWTGTLIEDEGKKLLPLATGIAAIISGIVWLQMDGMFTVAAIKEQIIIMATIYPAALLLPAMWPAVHLMRAHGMAGNSIVASTLLANTQIFYTVGFESILLGIAFGFSTYVAVVMIFFALTITFKGTPIVFGRASWCMAIYAISAAALNTYESFVLKESLLNPGFVLFWGNIFTVLFMGLKTKEIGRHKPVLIIGSIQLFTLPALTYMLKTAGSTHCALVVASGYVAAKVIGNFFKGEISNLKAICISGLVLGAVGLIVLP